MAFQANAFQHNAFQVILAADGQSRGSGGYSKRGRRKLLESRLYTPDDIIKMNELLDAARDQRLAYEAEIRFKKLQDDNALIALLMSS